MNSKLLTFVKKTKMIKEISEQQKLKLKNCDKNTCSFGKGNGCVQ